MYSATYWLWNLSWYTFTRMTYINYFSEMFVLLLSNKVKPFEKDTFFKYCVLIFIDYVILIWYTLIRMTPSSVKNLSNIGQLYRTQVFYLIAAAQGRCVHNCVINWALPDNCRFYVSWHSVNATKRLMKWCSWKCVGICQRSWKTHTMAIVQIGMVLWEKRAVLLKSH